MAANATAVWRVRPSGNNNNGGGFDCSISAAATGTHGSFTGTTFTDATAAAFTSGMAGSAINITGIGQYKISAFIDASNITLSGGNPGVTLSGGQAWTVGSGQDYSQQNAAQLTQSGGTISTSTVTLTDTGASFTTAVIGNAIRVAGTGITTTYTFITARPSATTLTLQTSPGTTGTSVTYNIGGGWADFWTNCSATSPVLVTGNNVYILGSGVPNPAAYTYDYDATTSFNPATFWIPFSADPATPSYKAPPDTTGGMPVIKFHVAGALFNCSSSTVTLNGLWFVGTTTAATNYVAVCANFDAVLFGCVLDQFSFDVGFLKVTIGFGEVVGCEVFSSVSGSVGSASGFLAGGNGVTLIVSGCNVHDVIGIGITSSYGNSNFLSVTDTIVAKGNSDGIRPETGLGGIIKNCTIDGNLGNGISCPGVGSVVGTVFYNNIISNHTGVGKFGVSANVTSAGVGQIFLFDYNIFYNNTADLHNCNYGPHDTHGGSNPYVGQTTENYTLA